MNFVDRENDSTHLENGKISKPYNTRSATPYAILQRY